MIYTFFDRKSKGSGFKIEVKHNEQIAEELQKSIIRNFKKRTVYSEFKDNIWGADLTDMQLVVHNRATWCSDTRQKQSPISICPFLILFLMPQKYTFFIKTILLRQFIIKTIHCAKYFNKISA